MEKSSSASASKTYRVRKSYRISRLVGSKIGSNTHSLRGIEEKHVVFLIPVYKNYELQLLTLSITVKIIIVLKLVS